MATKKKAKKKVAKKKAKKKVAKKKVAKKKRVRNPTAPPLDLAPDVTQEFIPRTVGRPSKYKPAFCQQIVDAMEKGYSKEAAAISIGIVKDTFYNWVLKYPEFSDAVKEGEQRSRLFWERLGMAGAAGRIPNFNSTAWIFNMKNRHGWADKQEISGPGGGPIDTKFTVEVVDAISHQKS